MNNTAYSFQLDGSEVAVIGMDGRFPKTKNINEFWNNLKNGVETISFFSKEELESVVGLDPDELNSPNYVRAHGLLEDVELFDASFFGYSPRDAEIMDPQHRIFLECAWNALENAGYDVDRYEGLISVYAGVTLSSYMLHLYPHKRFLRSLGIDPMMLSVGNDKDALSTRVSYKLDLRGPSLSVQTGCSTSLVAVHVACQSLLNEECDMALAGGVSILLPQKRGYLFQEGGIDSPDGHCRAFDAKARGTVFGSGVGIVVLKRLENALRDRDCIHAIIKGSAINNDGGLKAGFTAPNVDGQAAVIVEALANAGVDAESITYVETHGTGTALGDPIEITALTKAFRETTSKKGFCAVGSVKTNIGHLEVAAGIAGFIKTILALKHKLIPASLNFEQPNPEINFANSPFYVNTELSNWEVSNSPRRAGVSSFGFGGTNAHVILEEAFIIKTSTQSRPWQLLLLSAKTESALATMTANLVAEIKHQPEINLADVAYTLQVGRKVFNHKCMLVCQDLNNAVTALETQDPKRVFTVFQEPKELSVVFMFPGQGSHYVNMAAELYQVEPLFRQQIDRCSEFLKPHLGLDIRHVIYPSDEQVEYATEQLKQTCIAQPAIFVVEYALAMLWKSWGIHPQVMIGHSVGEYVAACLAEVFTLEDALTLIAARGRLIQELSAGTMLSVPLSEQELLPLLGEDLSLAAVNGPALCTVSGLTEAIEVLQNQLTEQGLTCRRLHTSHAFHSKMMEPILEAFIEQVERINLKAPKIPYISNVSGTWITTEAATSKSYWAEHLRQTVRFAEGVQELLKEPNRHRILLEVGPGNTLSTLAKLQIDSTHRQIVFSSVRHIHDQISDVAFLLDTLGTLWMAGISVDWAKFYAYEQRDRLPLPTYPFEPQRYWIEPQEQEPQAEEPQKQVYPNLTEPSNTPTASITANSINPGDTLMHPRPTLKNAYVVPRNEIEQTIANIWQSFLSIEKVGVHDNFFELGGHSLQSIQIISRVREAFQVDINAREFFQVHTVSDLAQLIINSKSKEQNLSNINQILEDVETLTQEKVQEELSEKPQVDRKEAFTAFADAPSIQLDTDSRKQTSSEQPVALTSNNTKYNGQGLTIDSRKASKNMQFSVFFFSGDESALTENKYKLVLESAKFAEQCGFTAIWTPERHFHKFGGLYPNPSVLSAALAMVTNNIQIRAGSTVLPLHHPVRTTEEWAVVDNLSGGRVGVCFAPGFHPNDFVFAPESFAENKEIMFRNIQIVQRLWQGESVFMRNGTGDNIQVKIFPRPVQSKLPIWISATGNPKTFAKAGEIGANILTSLIGLTFEELAERIILYREALMQHGYNPEEKKVSLMIHTYMGDDIDTVKEKARKPYCKYLRSHSDLLTTMTQGLGETFEPNDLSEDDLDDLFSSIFERHFNTKVLLGTPSSCLPFVKSLQSIGVNEIACLVDFGIDFDSVMKSLYYVNELKAQIMSHK
jgi:natural product biosynthesis luciferase-like monooxygenase protein